MKASKIEKNLRSLPAIRFHKSYKPANYQEVIQKMGRGLGLYNNQTYYDSNNKTQSLGGCYRGISDIYRVVIYYFPETTLKEVINYLLNVKFVCSGYCSTTAQTVIKAMGNQYTTMNSLNHNLTMNTMRTAKFGKNVKLIDIKYDD